MSGRLSSTICRASYTVTTLDDRGHFRIAAQDGHRHLTRERLIVHDHHLELRHRLNGLAVYHAHRQCDRRDRPAIGGLFEIGLRGPVLVQALQSQTRIASAPCLRVRRG